MKPLSFPTLLSFSAVLTVAGLAFAEPAAHPNGTFVVSTGSKRPFNGAVVLPTKPENAKPENAKPENAKPAETGGARGTIVVSTGSKRPFNGALVLPKADDGRPFNGAMIPPKGGAKSPEAGKDRGGKAGEGGRPLNGMLVTGGGEAAGQSFAEVKGPTGKAFVRESNGALWAPVAAGEKDLPPAPEPGHVTPGLVKGPSGATFYRAPDGALYKPLNAATMKADHLRSGDLPPVIETEAK